MKKVRKLFVIFAVPLKASETSELSYIYVFQKEEFAS